MTRGAAVWPSTRWWPAAASCPALCAPLLLFSNVHVRSYSRIEDAVIFPEVQIGRRCVIRKAIIDKGLYHSPDTRMGSMPRRTPPGSISPRVAWCW